MKLFISVFILLFGFSSVALDFKKVKIRAREHYEIVNLERGSDKVTFRGLSQSINLWYEDPYNYSLGFVLSPVIGDLKAKDTSNTLSNRIKLFNIGIDWKYFPKVLSDQFFIHTSLNHSRLKTSDEVSHNGYSAYFGSGHEFRFNRFGLALELAYRYSKLEDGYVLKAFIPSIGFHLYDFI